MKGKCPSCGHIDEYESLIDVCKECGKSVKLLFVAETEKPKKEKPKEEYEKATKEYL